jgi:hemolysin D
METSADPVPSFVPPQEAPTAQIVQTRAAMIEQVEHKIATLDQQIAQKMAEAEKIAATIAKLEASLPFVTEQGRNSPQGDGHRVRQQAGHLDAQIRLADQKNGLTVQQRKAAESTAARKALERQRQQASSEYATRS